MTFSRNTRDNAKTAIIFGLLGLFIGAPLSVLAWSAIRPPPISLVREAVAAEAPLIQEVHVPPGEKVLEAAPEVRGGGTISLAIRTRPMGVTELPETYTVYRQSRILNTGMVGPCPNCPQPPLETAWRIIESRR